MTIHDSLWVDALSEGELEVRNTVAEIIITAGELNVPLEVEFD